MGVLAEKFLRPEKYPGTACQGCGLRLAHDKILQAIDALQLPIGDVVWGTGIGCSGRQTYATWKGDTFAATHGRVYAMATGLRLALPPEKRLILTVGDGDAFTIGLSHLLHCARRNVDMTVIVCDNLGYQSTGGQYSITTPLNSRTDSSPYGTYEPNWTENGLDILRIVQQAGATFLARHTVFQDHAVETIQRAILNRGFSLVQLIYPCVSHFGVQALGLRNVSDVHRWFREHTDNEPTVSRPDSAAFTTGIIHDTSNGRPEFSQQMREHIQRVQAKAGNNHV